MPALRLSCEVKSLVWITPTVMRIRFEPSEDFPYVPGQFVSLVIPRTNGNQKPFRRAYSLSCAPHEGYELCVKYYENGVGSQYWSGMRAGDRFEITAPYGDFQYVSDWNRNVVFISTGTGITPFLSMIRDRELQEHPPKRLISVFGARTVDEIISPGLFERKGFESVNCLSQARGDWDGFRGRVTEYLKTLPNDWIWHQTDFYLCGNGEMVSQVRNQLLNGRGVHESAIKQEVFFAGGSLEFSRLVSEKQAA